MKKIENECVGCVDIGLPCMGSSCSKRHVAHYYCDDCGEEETLYHFEGEELCVNCIIKRLEIVEGSEN